MFDDSLRLRENSNLLALLSHYAQKGAEDRTTWRQRLMKMEGVEPKQMSELHGELIAFDWIEQNTGHTLSACYRITLNGLREYSEGGEGKNGPAKEIGKGTLTVTVPAKVWRVILVLPREDAQNVFPRFARSAQIVVRLGVSDVSDRIRLRRLVSVRRMMGPEQARQDEAVAQAPGYGSSQQRCSHHPLTLPAASKTFPTGGRAERGSHRHQCLL
jgi:hypothetical protein